MTGEFIERDKSTETTIEIMVEITIRGLRQDFLVVGRIEDRKYDRETLAAKLRVAVLEWLPQRRIYDLFRRTEIDLKADSSETVETSATIEIDQTTADFFEAQAKIGNEASSYLENILEEMQEMIQSPNEYRHQLQRGISFLESSLRVSGNSFMHGWCSEKLSRMRSGLTDLLKRKNTNHPTYINIQNEIRGWLSHWPVRNVWVQQPPRPMPKISRN